MPLKNSGGWRKLAYLLAFGCFIRLFYIGNIPGNKALFVDEMFSGYEAWSMLHFGFDSHGYHLPVYLEVWGSGMSVLQAYLQMPFIAIFGLNSFAVRLPAAIVGCISLYAFYYICKKIRGEDFALFALFMFVIMPWHIMQSRWGLDCNLFSGFSTISIALILKAQENSKYLPLASFLLGCTLYTYALTWSVMPLIVLGAFVFLVASKSIRFDRYLIVSVIIFCAMATPLILFVLVNYGLIDEIITPFISIPKLLQFRTNELDLSLRSLVSNSFETLKLFVNQDDGRVGDCTPLFGIYYKFSNMFILFGIALSLSAFFDKEKEDRMHGEILIWLVFIGGIIVGAIVLVYFTRINIIHMPVTYFCASGIYYFIQKLGKEFKKGIITLYGIACIAFLAYYFTEYDDTVALKYLDGCEAAISYVDEMKTSGVIDKNAQVHVLSGMSFLHVLFYKQYPTDKYIDEVEWSKTAMEEGSLIPLKVDDYDFSFLTEHTEPKTAIAGDVYICSSDNHKVIEFMRENGMEETYLGHMACGISK